MKNVFRRSGDTFAANFNPRSFGEDQKSFLAHEAAIRIRKAPKKKRQPHSVPATLFAPGETHRASRCKQPINIHVALSSRCDRKHHRRFICENDKSLPQLRRDATIPASFTKFFVFASTLEKRFICGC